MSVTGAIGNVNGSESDGSFSHGHMCDDDGRPNAQLAEQAAAVIESKKRSVL